MAQDRLSGKSPRAHSSQRFWPAAIAVGVPVMMGLCRSDVGLGYTEMAMQKLALMGLHTFFHINVFAKVCGSEGVHPYFPPYPEATEHDRCRMGSASAK